jgi:hypothetical protein
MRNWRRTLHFFDDVKSETELRASFVNDAAGSHNEQAEDGGKTC